MRKSIKILAFDFGASSGRTILGTFDGNRLFTEEIHRFSNDPVQIGTHLHWDILRLFHEIKQGILKSVNGGNRNISSMAIDTWGVDFGLLDKAGNLLSNPFHYRDCLTDNIMAEVFKIVPEKELYMMTGLQLIKFNTLFQLFAMVYKKLPVLEQAETLLMMSDLFNYFLTGVKTSEYCIASTTQLLDPYKRVWSGEIISRLQLPEDIYPEIVNPGTIIGKLSTDISSECGIGELPVVATASHDSASAVVSVPASEKDFVYISCGTWSIMGIESDGPVINEKSFSLSYANEGGVNNQIRFLRMIMGLWIIQECKRQWDREGRNYGFDELEHMALEVQPFNSFIDPDDNIFMSPGNMPERIAKYCIRTGQKVPESVGEYVRCIAQSLALKYRMTIENLELVLNKKLNVIHMVGGGTKDKMLCEFTANATGRTVNVGPVEATAVGNLMVQAMALGEVKNLQEIRCVVKDSFSIDVYQPRDVEQWDEAYYKFIKILSKHESNF